MDDKESATLLDYLDAINPPHGHDCWREYVSGQWFVFLAYNNQTYRLLPVTKEMARSIR